MAAGRYGGLRRATARSRTRPVCDLSVGCKIGSARAQLRAEQSLVTQPRETNRRMRILYVLSGKSVGIKSFPGSFPSAQQRLRGMRACSAAGLRAQARGQTQAPYLKGLVLFCSVLLQGALSYEVPSFFEVTVPRMLETKVGWDPKRKVSYAVTFGGWTYTLHLTQNRELLPSVLQLYSHTLTGHLLREEERVIRRDCYYQGSIQGIPGSIVALSICHGLRGILQTEAFTYGIEPAEFSSTFQHLIYIVDNMDNDPKSCVTIQPERAYLEIYEYKMHHAMLPGHTSQAHFISLHVIIDNDLFLHYSENSTVLLETVFQVLNLADSMFAPLNVHLVLSGIEIWKIKNVILSSVNVRTFLKNLATWKQKNLDPSLKVDMTVLLRKNDIESTIGATFAEEICWGYNAVMFVAFTNFPRRDLPAIATTLSHELGHALGMQHDSADTRKCDCPLGSCIMFSGRVTTASFSDCSLKYFADFVSNGGGFCLQRPPSAQFASVIPFCGNKVVEEGEQCDCGTENECASDLCCDATCKFKGGAKCAYGECCKVCQFVKKGVPCRLPFSECDLAEYCNGTSAFCPADVYLQDGSPCNHNQSYCVNNKCYDYTKHCKSLFGKGATVASIECFLALNTNGDRFGNCGFEGEGGLFQKCEISDVMCGRVQCNNVKTIHIYNPHSATIQTRVGNKWCWGVDYHYSYNIKDFGAVEDGAKCGSAKVCINRKCVHISTLDYDCNAHGKCHGRGVCNNKKNCHCNKEWAPPDCQYEGHGGSVDSGPLVKGSFVTYVTPKTEEFKFMELIPPTVGTPKDNSMILRHSVPNFVFLIFHSFIIL